MKISVFTPTHNPEYIVDVYSSLLNQTYKDWEWIIYVNGHAISNTVGFWDTTELKFDSRVKIVFASNSIAGVGEAKSIACKHTTGEILLELDHDDFLHPNALYEISLAFENPNIGFVYSQFIQVNEDKSPNLDKFNHAHGWEYDFWEFDGKRYIVPNGFEPHPHNIGYIWYAPNHLRAFRKSIYEKVGGYNREKKILDDQDLMIRMYEESEFYFIKKPLYFQRIHKDNTHTIPSVNKKIQEETVSYYINNIEKLMLVWSKRNNLRAIDLGSRHDEQNGFEGVDLISSHYADDLFYSLLSMEDNSVGVVKAVDCLQYIPDKIKLIKEIYRVLAPNGMLLSMTPSTDGRGAFQDPTHTAFYNENSFWYYTREQKNYVNDLNDIRFQEGYLSTSFPSQWHKDNYISYVRAYLIALKGGYRLGGVVKC